MNIFKNLLTLNNMICKACDGCGRTRYQCQKYTLDQIILCSSCKKCIKCKKDFCKKCCDKCSICDKILPKNNFPNEEIIDGKCDKCLHSCTECDRYVSDSMCILKDGTRWCSKCFDIKFNPSTKLKKYKIVLKNNTRIFLLYKEEKEKLECTACSKKFWRYIGKPNLCKDCTSTDLQKFLKSSKDPSDSKLKYTLITIKEKGKNIFKWKQSEKLVVCRNCSTSMWILSDNLNKTNIYYCSRCKPNIKNKKLKYDLKRQMWIAWSEKKECIVCNRVKWLRPNVERCGICAKLVKNLNEKCNN